LCVYMWHDVLLQKHFLCFNTMAEPASNLGNFPRCNWFQRKKKSGAIWFFEAKDLVDQKKNNLGLGQPRIIFYFIFCIDQDYLFFLLAIVRPD
jgi:hypothetical protein